VKLPLLLSVPHAGVRIPDEVADYCILTPSQVAEDGDEGAAEIYDLSAAVRAFRISDVARAIVDLNRAEDDRRGDGVVKTHTCLDVPVYDPFPPEETVQRLLERYYRPFHAALRELAAGEVRLGLDCHTMLAQGPPIGPLAGQDRPWICLSNLEGRSCPNTWLETVASCLRETFGCEVALNHPFKGGFITQSHAAELPWLQLELSRAPFLSNAEKRESVLAALRLFCERVE
jgi:formiminoglutamase